MKKLFLHFLFLALPMTTFAEGFLLPGFQQFDSIEITHLNRKTQTLYCDTVGTWHFYPGGMAASGSVSACSSEPTNTLLFRNAKWIVSHFQYTDMDARRTYEFYYLGQNCAIRANERNNASNWNCSWWKKLKDANLPNGIGNTHDAPEDDIDWSGAAYPGSSN